MEGLLRIVTSSGAEIINLNGLQSSNTAPHYVFTDTWRTTNTASLLEYVDLGAPEREETWIHPSGGSSYLGRIIDRPTEMTLVIHLQPHQTHAALRETARAIRNQFEFSQAYVEYGESANDYLRFRTYPSKFESPFGLDALGAAMVVSQMRVLDWSITLWREPYPVAGMVSGSSSTVDVNHLPML